MRFGGFDPAKGFLRTTGYTNHDKIVSETAQSTRHQLAAHVVRIRDQYTNALLNYCHHYTSTELSACSLGSVAYEHTSRLSGKFDYSNFRTSQ
jgi:hypothetical protein